MCDILSKKIKKNGISEEDIRFCIYGLAVIRVHEHYWATKKKRVTYRELFSVCEELQEHSNCLLQYVFFSNAKNLSDVLNKYLSDYCGIRLSEIDNKVDDAYKCISLICEQKIK